MSRRTILLYGLALVLAVAAAFLFLDGLLMRPTAPPASGQAAVPAPDSGGAPAPDADRWAYACEQHWLGSEIARAIVNLAGSAVTGRLTLVDDLDVRWLPGDSPLGSFSVARPNRQLRPVEVTSHLWSPDTWTPMAAELLGDVAVPPSSPGGEPAFLTALTTNTPDTLAAQAAAVSAALAPGMRDPALHERAAFLLAVFALREEADAFSDVRGTLGRVTAHMAVARALRHGQPSSVAGTLALVIQSAMLGRQVEALAWLNSAPVAAEPAAAPWRRALAIRITGDWRTLAHPAGATLLERLEYTRAIRERRSVDRALDFLDSFTPEPIPDWGRIVTRGGANVEGGRRFFDGLNTIEAAEVRTIADRLIADLPKDAMVNDPVGLLNERPVAGSVLLVQGQPAVRVLDWGTWAAFFQRHLAARLMLESYFYRRTLGDQEAERTHNQLIATQYGGIRLAPLVRRYVETDAAEYERVMADARALLVQHPEAVTALNWMLLMEKPEHARLRPEVPAESAWFAPSLPGGTAFETEARLWGPGHSRRPTLDQSSALAALKPYDFDLAWDTLVLGHGEPPPLEAEEQAYAPFVAFDLRALRGLSTAALGHPVRYREVLIAACELDGDSCYSLASYHAQSGQPARAAAMFERWMAQARDRVRVANGIGWLVTYYRASGQAPKARKLAQMAADVYSYTGLTVHAGQLECDGRYAEAEAVHHMAVERYQNSHGLLAFYLRQARREPHGRWKEKAAPLERQLLGGELQPTDMAGLSGPPVDGLTVTRVGVAAERAGLRVGDILVGLDGSRVPTNSHYAIAEALGDGDAVTFIVWRRDHYEQVRGTFPQRYFPFSFEAYRPQR